MKKFLLRLLPNSIYVVLRHIVQKKRIPPLWNPKRFSDIMMRKMLFEREPLRCLIADKYLVRDYVAARIGASYLTKMYFYGNNFKKADFDKLPTSFVIKPAHASAKIKIIKNKKQTSFEELSKLCKEWLKLNHGHANREYIYQGLKPGIIIEEYLQDTSGEEAPNDYKFFVFYGKPYTVQVDKGRFGEHSRTFYTPDSWEKMKIIYRAHLNKQNIAIPRSARLDEMALIAKKLGADFDFIRVDLYDLGDRIVFGELTNFPSGCTEIFEPLEVEEEMGKMLLEGKK